MVHLIVFCSLSSLRANTCITLIALDTMHIHTFSQFGSKGGAMPNRRDVMRDFGIASNTESQSRYSSTGGPVTPSSIPYSTSIRSVHPSYRGSFGILMFISSHCVAVCDHGRMIQIVLLHRITTSLSNAPVYHLLSPSLVLGCANTRVIVEPLDPKTHVHSSLPTYAISHGPTVHSTKICSSIEL